MSLHHQTTSLRSSKCEREDGVSEDFKVTHTHTHTRTHLIHDYIAGRGVHASVMEAGITVLLIPPPSPHLQGSATVPVFPPRHVRSVIGPPEGGRSV